MRTLYLSGAISNNPNYKREFEAARKDLIDAGYTVISPLDICDDCVAFIPSGYKSDGMALELYIAERLGMPVRTVENWIKEGE